MRRQRGGTEITSEADAAPVGGLRCGDHRAIFALVRPPRRGMMAARNSARENNRPVNLVVARYIHARAAVGRFVPSFVKTFWEICILQAAPQDLPTSRSLLLFSLAVYFAINLFSGWLQISAPLALPAALADTVLLVVLTRVMLWVRSFDARFVQTLTALAGSGAVMGLIATPILYWQHYAGGAEGEFTLPSLLLLLWMAWSVVVMGHVLRHAMSTMLVIGLTLAVIYMHFAFRLLHFLFLTNK